MTDARAAASLPQPSTTFGRGLPVLGRTVYTLEALAPRPSTAGTHLTALAAADPGLAVRLFADVNAELERAGRAPASQLQHAVVILGVPAFVERYGTLPVVREDDPDPRVRTVLRIFARGHHAAQQARAFSEHLPSVSAADAESALLALHGLEAARALTEVGGDAATGIDVEVLAAGLPPLARDLDGDEPGSRCVRLAAELAAQVAACWDDTVLEPCYAALAELLRREPDTVARMVKRTAAAAARAGGHFHVRPAAVNLLSPGPWPDDGDGTPDAMPAAVENTASAAEPPRETPDAAAPDRAEPATAPTPDALGVVLDELRAALAAGRSSSALLSIALAGLNAAAGYRLALFWLLDRRAGAFTLKLHEGTALPEDLAGYSTSTADSPLFTKLVERTRTLALHPERDRSVLGRLDPTVRRLIGRHACALHAVVVNGRPLGVIMACRPTEADGAGHLRRIVRTLDQALAERARSAAAVT